MRTRATSRLILLDEEKQILLFKFEDLIVFNSIGPVINQFWILPGGGLEQGETFEEAARRELWEETGIQQVSMSPCIWVRDVVVDWQGEQIQHYERFYLANIKNQQLDMRNMEVAEAKAFRGHRWWTYEALRSSTEIIFPKNLAAILKPVLDGQIPSMPINLTE